jgi:lipopolysaccharide biosynthesis glycosyltransferase
MSDVVYIVDKRYFDLFKVSCYSLIDKTTIDLNIYILTKDKEFDVVEEEKIIKFFSSIRDKVSIKFVKSDLFNEFKKNGLIHPIGWCDDTALLKCFLHDALPDVNWVTYLDSDTMIYKNIDEFLKSTYDFPLAAAADINYHQDTDYMYVCLASYRTSLDFWRKNNFTELFKKELPLKDEYYDQDILNRYFKHNKVVLPLKYCAQNFYEEATPMIRSLFHAMIIHFGGPVKPNHPSFSGNFHNPWHKEWKEYYIKTGDLSV